MHSDGMLIIISGPSGSGKGTVVRALDPARFSLSISMTTRKKRPGEVEAVDYFFCTEEEFMRVRGEGGLLEHASFVGHYYGTPRFYVEEQIALGKAVVLEIEVNGALQVKEKFPDAVLIFLIPPTRKDLEERLIKRNTEDKETIEDRLLRSEEELRLLPRYDYLVVNDTVPNAVALIETIVRAESLKPNRNRYIIDYFNARR